MVGADRAGARALALDAGALAVELAFELGLPESEFGLELGILRREFGGLFVDDAKAHLTPGGGLLCEIGRCKPVLEKAYPRADLLWLDTEESEGEVFWVEAGAL